MTAAQYRAIFALFNDRPAAKKMLAIVGKSAAALVYAAYLLGLAAALWQSGWQGLVPLAAVPAAAFLLGTVLRAAIDRPRPYEALGFAPLFPKATKGQSMPSRHCFSAAAIAVTLGSRWLVVGAVLALVAVVIALCRVLMGHHYPSDVLAGLAFGAGAAWAGLGLFALLAQ